MKGIASSSVILIPTDMHTENKKAAKSVFESLGYRTWFAGRRGEAFVKNLLEGAVIQNASIEADDVGTGRQVDANAHNSSMIISTHAAP